MTPCTYPEWLEHIAQQLSNKPGCIQLMADIKAAHAEGKTIILFLTSELADDADYLGLLSWLCFVISCELGADPSSYLEQHQAEEEPQEDPEPSSTEDNDVPEANTEEGLYAPQEGDEDLSNAEVIFDNLDWLDKNFGTDTMDVDTEVMTPDMAHIDLGRLRAFVEGDATEIDADTKAHILNLQDFLSTRYDIAAKIYRKVVSIVRKRTPQAEDGAADHEVPTLTPDAVTGTDAGKA